MNPKPPLLPTILGSFIRPSFTAAIMDPETFLDMANQVTKLKMYPYFDLAHSAACLLAIREEMGAGMYVSHSRRS